MRGFPIFLLVVISLAACRSTRLAKSGNSFNIDSIGFNDNNPVLPPPAPIPAVPETLPVASVEMGDTANVPEAISDFPISEGVFKPTWKSINDNYPQTATDWLREAKFGIWVHFGPQAAGESGDWYARKMYMEDRLAYKNHAKKYGSPVDSGYKEVLRDWNPTKLDPAAYVKLYQQIGARFLLIQAVHHDNYDMWNSKYQPWNSVNIGPHKDLLGEWAKAVKSANMHFGVAFHHEYTWWWWQTAFRSDSKGPNAGKMYDGRLTLADGKGTWWEGYDPRLLYGINLREYKGMDRFEYNLPKGIFSRHTEYAKWYTNRWALRILDVISKYDPDFIYTDGNSTQPFSGWNSGTGYKCDADQRVIASYFNHAQAKHGKVDVFSITKFHPAGQNGIVTTFEGWYPDGIKTDQPWIGENAVGDWFYAPDYVYDASSVIRFLLEYVSKDGAYAVSIPIMPDGSLDTACQKMLYEIGNWMKINGKAIYGSRAWKVAGEGGNGKLRSIPGGSIGPKQADFTFYPDDLRFTVGKDGSLNVFTMMVPEEGSEIVVHSLGLQAKDKIPLNSINLLGSKEKISWTQKDDGLHIIVPNTKGFKTSLCFNIK
jgi:alpha-L-fucosidase